MGHSATVYPEFLRRYKRTCDTETLGAPLLSSNCKLIMSFNRSNTCQFHPAFPKVLEHMKKPLLPLMSLTTGQPHPKFPRTLLQYHLLSADVLDELASFYIPDTVITNPATGQQVTYPLPTPSWFGEDVSLEEKRFYFGVFIGLYGTGLFR